MNLKTFASASLFAVLGMGAITAQASTLPTQGTAPMQYHYGEHLDVKKVLSVQDDRNNGCGPVNTRMDYLDSHGQPQSLQYRSYATAGCHDN